MQSEKKWNRMTCFHCWFRLVLSCNLRSGKLWFGPANLFQSIHNIWIDSLLLKTSIIAKWHRICEKCTSNNSSPASTSSCFLSLRSSNSPPIDVAQWLPDTDDRFRSQLRPKLTAVCWVKWWEHAQDGQPRHLREFPTDAYVKTHVAWVTSISMMIGKYSK